MLRWSPGKDCKGPHNHQQHSSHSLKTSGAPKDKEMLPVDLQIIIITVMPWYQSGPCSSCMIAPFIPIKLRVEMMEHLRASHAGASELLARASNSVYCLNMRTHIVSYRAEYISCTKNAPSNPVSPPLPYQNPTCPFHYLFRFLYSENNITIVDRYIGSFFTLLTAKKMIQNIS